MRVREEEFGPYFDSRKAAIICISCDGVRSDEDVHEKAKFMLQTLAFNRKVGPEILETGLEKNKVDQGCIYFLLAKDNRRLG